MWFIDVRIWMNLPWLGLGVEWKQQQPYHFKGQLPPASVLGSRALSARHSQSLLCVAEQPLFVHQFLQQAGLKKENSCVAIKITRINSIMIYNTTRIEFTNSIDWNPVLAENMYQASPRRCTSNSKLLRASISCHQTNPGNGPRPFKSKTCCVQRYKVVNLTCQWTWHLVGLQIVICIQVWFVFRTQDVQSTCLSKILILWCSGSLICLLLWYLIWF